MNLHRLTRAAPPPLFLVVAREGTTAEDSSWLDGSNKRTLLANCFEEPGSEHWELSICGVGELACYAAFSEARKKCSNEAILTFGSAFDEMLEKVPPGWTAEESRVLTRYFVRALRACLSTPLEAASELCDILEAAGHFFVEARLLTEVWLQDDSPLALSHLLETIEYVARNVSGVDHYARLVIANEAVRQRLEQEFFAGEPSAEEVARGEDLVRLLLDFPAE